MSQDKKKNNKINNQIAVFKGKQIRKTIFRKEWWFSILDIIKTLTDSPQPKTCWAKMKDTAGSKLLLGASEVILSF